MNTFEHDSQVSNRAQRMAGYIGEKVQFVKALLTNDLLEKPSWAYEQTAPIDKS